MEALLIGRTLAGRYRVEDVLGRGGMSVVYRAVDSRLGRTIALKVIAFPPGMSADDRTDLRNRLMREAAAVACIASHPNVVQVYDHGSDDELDLDFITMELLVGDDLKSLLAKGGVGIEEGLDILRQATRGVAAGHRAGILHRDVKPGNIFLVEGHGLVVKVLDFGIAKAFEAGADDDITQAATSPHSPGYASPEQLAGGVPQTTASDVYQLGLIAYEILSGERPFSADERRELAAGCKRRLPEKGRWNDVPSEIRSVIEKALEPDPFRRYQSADELLVALEAALDNDATMVYVAPAPGVGEDETRSVEGSPSAPARIAPPTPVAVSAGGRRYALYAGSAAAILLLIWLLSQAGSEPSVAVATADDTTAVEPVPVENVDFLDSQFRSLLMEAHEQLREADQVQ